MQNKVIVTEWADTGAGRAVLVISTQELIHEGNGVFSEKPVKFHTGGRHANERRKAADKIAKDYQKKGYKVIQIRPTDFGGDRE